MFPIKKNGLMVIGTLPMQPDIKLSNICLFPKLRIQAGARITETMFSTKYDPVSYKHQLEIKSSSFVLKLLERATRNTSEDQTEG